MLPNSLNVEDWINPDHLSNQNNVLQTAPFEHCVFTQFFKEEIFIALREICEQIDLKMYSDHPAGGYRFAALPNVEFFKFIYSTPFKQFLKSKLSLNLTLCKAFPCPQVYLFDKKGVGLEIHNDFDINQSRDFGMIIYLHNHWDPSFGGELQLYEKENLNTAYKTINPSPNTIVGFRVSPISYHSVKPSSYFWNRMSIVVDWDLY